MGIKKWVVSDYDKQLAKELANECDIDPIVALIASSRGLTDPYELEQFLSDELCFTDFYVMADIVKAATVINDAISNNEKIAVFGDYDCDGICATAILCKYLKLRNADFIYYIPDRFSEGYGMNKDAVDTLKEKGVSLIITVDNGIVCFDEIDYANSLGLKVVVTDHHLPSDKLPNALAIVNPHRIDCPSEFKQICGAEVAFRLVCVLESKEPEEIIWDYSDLLSVAIIADIMPLTFENRSILKCGINKLQQDANFGLYALLNVSGVQKSALNSSKIAFSICPRINAAGRMGSAETALELLLTDNMSTALKIATELDDKNAERQRIEKQIFDEAVGIIERENFKFDPFIVVCGNNWHHGVVGIVSARITEKYGVPSIVLSSDGETANGSGRSIEGFDIYNAISSAKDLTLKFGGHKQAAGITLKTENIGLFRERLNNYCKDFKNPTPLLKLDCKLNPEALSLDLAFALSSLEPFGEGNPAPLFGLYGVKLERITPIANDKHLRLLFSKGNNSFQTLLFGVSSKNFCFCVGDILDLAVSVEPNFYNGEYSVSVLTKGIRISGIDDTKFFEDLWDYNNFSAGRDYKTESLLPTRHEVGIIYKKILEKPILEDRLKYIYILEIGLGKTLVILKILSELGLIVCQNGLCSAVSVSQKTDLNNSNTFKKLKERGIE